MIEYQKNQILGNQFSTTDPFTLQLKPHTRQVKQSLKDRSKNNINPLLKVKVTPKEGQTISEVFSLLSSSFQEDVQNLVIHTDQDIALTEKAHSHLPINALRFYPKCTYAFNALTL